MVGHCNWEFMPLWLYTKVPLLKYLIYTPSYHSLHHSRVHTNFCLFMPIYDWMFGTLERDNFATTNTSTASSAAAPAAASTSTATVDGWTSIKVQAQARARSYEVPECVFLAHGTDLLSALHLPMFLRGYAKDPYKVCTYFWWWSMVGLYLKSHSFFILLFFIVTI